MALSLSPFPLNFLSPSPLCFRNTHFTVSLSQQTIQFDPSKNKRKPRPNFSDQIRDKWSIKNPNLISKTLPWQNPEHKNQIQIDPIEENEIQDMGNAQIRDKWPIKNPKLISKTLPWQNPEHKIQIQIDPIEENEIQDMGNAQNRDKWPIKDPNLIKKTLPWQNQEKKIKIQIDPIEENEIQEMGNGFLVYLPPWVHGNLPKETQLSEMGIENEANLDGEFNDFVEIDETPSGFNNFAKEFDGSIENEETPIGLSEKIRVPWEREKVGGERVIIGNTVYAERSIPETELRRLRNVAKRMVERIKVGSAGVNQELVNSIRIRWRENEVVKLKFEGAPTLNMKRTHEVLESRTGGIVIWRSGSSIALHRGMTYNLPCVRLYTKNNHTTNSHSFSTTTDDEINQIFKSQNTVLTTESPFSRSTKYKNELSEKEITDLNELDSLLDELGPRFKDWSGPEPVPVDADLLPSIVPGGRRPFRLLPYGIRQSLREKETTFYRQSARRMPPHFALGRNRELQGLAMAMVKLWERSAIAKIAIKRGVQNTNNERMAEELKNLTGGTLLSRNKDFIVFYRGNDFLPPTVTKTLDEAQKEAILKEDEEEEARRKASTPIFSIKKSVKIIPKVAGTLAETLAATSRWANQPSNEEREKMRRDTALARHASMVKYLENKLAIANGKIKKAEKALAKVQESLSPAELPTDLETITDEERFLFRKIGLSMKPYLLLGRRGMFDGTIENIHLHWKYREVVKLIVDRKSFAQVKQIAIGLEAESGGVLVCVDKTMKGYLIILYRGKNYQRPNLVRPKNLLTKRQAWSRSIELQRREALKHHISDLVEKIERLKAELENTTSVEEIDEETFYSRMDDASSDEEMEEEGDEETMLDGSGDEEDDIF